MIDKQNNRQLLGNNCFIIKGVYDMIVCYWYNIFEYYIMNMFWQKYYGVFIKFLVF